jgi:hypothetical protein
MAFLSPFRTMSSSKWEVGSTERDPNQKRVSVRVRVSHNQPLLQHKSSGVQVEREFEREREQPPPPRALHSQDFNRPKAKKKPKKHTPLSRSTSSFWGESHTSRQCVPQCRWYTLLPRARGEGMKCPCTLGGRAITKNPTTTTTNERLWVHIAKLFRLHHIGYGVCVYACVCVSLPLFLFFLSFFLVCILSTDSIIASSSSCSGSSSSSS